LEAALRPSAIAKAQRLRLPVYELGVSAALIETDKALTGNDKAIAVRAGVSARFVRAMMGTPSPNDGRRRCYRCILLMWLSVEPRPRSHAAIASKSGGQAPSAG